MTKNKNTFLEIKKNIKLYLIDLNVDSIGKIILSCKFNNKKLFKQYFTEEGIYKVNYNSNNLLKLNFIDYEIKDDNYMNINDFNFVIDNSYINEYITTQLPYKFTEKYFIEESYFLTENENKNKLKFIIIKEIINNNIESNNKQNIKNIFSNKNNNFKDNSEINNIINTKIIDYYFLFNGTNEELYNHYFISDIRSFLLQLKMK
jgi:hypothetical protein